MERESQDKPSQVPARVFIVCLFLLPVIGVVCTVVGAVYPKPPRTPWLFSIPLCPTGTFPYTQYVGNWIPDTGVCSAYPPPEFAIPFPLSSIEQPEIEQTVLLIHNLWSYEIQLTLCSQPCSTSPFLFKLARDGVSSFHGLHMIAADGFLPSALVTDKKVNVYCPNPINLNRPEPASSCPKATGLFEKIEIGQVRYSDLNKSSEGSLVFRTLLATPRDINFRPQLYWASWAKPPRMNAVLITGIVFLSLGGFLWLLVGLFFLAVLMICGLANNDDRDRPQEA
jgi:hypothetical protein